MDYPQARAGHGAGMPLSESIEQIVDKQLLALHHLGSAS